MHVSNIDGSGNIERGSERTVRIPRPEQGGRAAGASGDIEDTATISQDGRERLHVLDAHADKLRSTDPERRALVEAARQRLQSGELDRPEVYRAVADAILRGDE